jgi:hypothetical protein
MIVNKIMIIQIFPNFIRMKIIKLIHQSNQFNKKKHKLKNT